MSYSVLEGTVKFNNANLLTSLFLKRKIENCKLPSVMQQWCCDSQHTMYFTVKESNSWAFSFLVCQTCWKKKIISKASVEKPLQWQNPPSHSQCGCTLLSAPPRAPGWYSWKLCHYWQISKGHVFKRRRWLAQVVAIYCITQLHQ